MIAFQHVEAARQALVGGAENREIMQVLDLVVHVELLQQELQPRHELAREIRPAAASRRGIAFSISRIMPASSRNMSWRDSQKRAISPRLAWPLPLLARVTRDQHAQILRPAAAAGERERVQIGVIGGFDGHCSSR